MDFQLPIMTAVFLLAADLISGDVGSNRWEHITAFWGLSCTALVVLVFFGIVNADKLPIALFCLLQALRRDIRRVLKGL